MNPTELIDIYISKLLQRVSKDNKTSKLMDYFYKDLLKYDTNTDCATFLNSIYMNFLLLNISTPTLVTRHSKTLTDTIFSNSFEDGLISGNITTTISDRYAQFLLKKNIKLQQTKQKLFRHKFRKFNYAEFDFEQKN